MLSEINDDGLKRSPLEAFQKNLKRTWLADFDAEIINAWILNLHFIKELENMNNIIRKKTKYSTTEAEQQRATLSLFVKFDHLYHTLLIFYSTADNYDQCTEEPT